MTEQTNPPICPIRKQPCVHSKCDYQENQTTGDTLCREWILKQQQEGKKEIEAKGKLVF